MDRAKKEPFVSVWRLRDDRDSITLPLPPGREIEGQWVPFNYDFQVDWGDGSAPSTVTGFDDYRRHHTYADAGDYTVTITGLCESWAFDYSDCDRPDEEDEYDEDEEPPPPPRPGAQNLIAIPNLGAVGWKSFELAFQNCQNLGRVAGGDTSKVTSMYGMFYDAASATPDTSGWDTSSVTDMSNMFHDATSANPDTSGWDTSRVTDMSAMFWGATRANPDTSRWDTSKVTNMSEMFSRTTSANPDVSGWDTSRVTYMGAMFSGATRANPDTSRWDTSSVQYMSSMFYNATRANPDVSSWDTSSVTNMYAMFSGSAADQSTLDWHAQQCARAEVSCTP